jgi:hypothetical protein
MAGFNDLLRLFTTTQLRRVGCEPKGSLPVECFFVEYYTTKKNNHNYPTLFGNIFLFYPDKLYTGATRQKMVVFATVELNNLYTGEEVNTF